MMLNIDAILWASYAWRVTMKLLWAILKTMGVVMGFAATYGTLVADAEGWDV